MASFKKRSLAEYAGAAARGFCMGCADVVPGVSGGTMAFILGIYEELIVSIKEIARPAFMRAVLRLEVKKALSAVNAPFLLSVFAGIILAVLTLARFIEHALETTPELIWSFFFGLVLASIVVVRKKILYWNNTLVVTAIVGTVVSFFIVGMVPVQTPETWWFLVLSGALAICAMILPGISGAFILVLLGKYEFILNAVNTYDFASVALVGIGAIFGLITFAQVLGWLFRRYHDVTVALLIGLMAGSLRKIWPWKESVGLAEENVWPAWSSGTAENAMLVMAIFLMIVGFLSILSLDRLASVNLKSINKKTSKSK